MGHSFHKPEVSYCAVDVDLVELSVLLETGALVSWKILTYTNQLWVYRDTDGV